MAFSLKSGQGSLQEPLGTTDRVSMGAPNAAGMSLSGWTPTPPRIVREALGLAALTRDDLLYDLGSGDGRVIVAAAQIYGARAVGFEGCMMFSLSG